MFPNPQSAIPQGLLVRNPQLAWWQRGVVYQIYPRSFQDSTGDGVGDLQGVINRLDYLNGAPDSLGIDAIWLSPIFPSPMADYGYDVADYCDIHPLFGDLATFDRLVQAAHRRDIKVIIDWVPNHSSDRHPWFIESRSRRDNPKRDWYIWRDAKPDGSLPNNWGSFFGGPAWEWDETTRQYYLHQFLNEQPDLNWRNPHVHDAMLDVLRFWLDRGVDGFRMDVIALIMKDKDLRDNPRDPNADPNLHPDDLASRSLRVYNEDQDEVHPVIRDIRRVLDEYGDTVGIGEISGGYPLPRWVKYYGDNANGLHLPFNFRLMDLPWTASGIRQSVNELEAALPAFGWPNYVLGNHDQSRLASRVGQGQARVAAMLLLTLRGTPTLYQGDEIGTPNVEVPPEKIQDPPGKRFGAEHGRDKNRSPMQWDTNANAGFSSAEPWLPLTPDWKTRNVAVQSGDPTSLLNLYRRLLHYRRATPALYGGSYRALDAGDENVFAYTRESGGDRRLVALNFTHAPRTLAIHGMSRGKIILSTYLDRADAVSLARLELRADEGVIIELT